MFYSLRPWDPMNDLLQYEHNYIAQTKTRHRTPIVRTTSITNVDELTRGHKRQSSLERIRAARIKRASMKHLHKMERESGSSTPDGEVGRVSDTSDSGGRFRQSKMIIPSRLRMNHSSLLRLCQNNINIFMKYLGCVSKYKIPENLESQSVEN